MTQLNLFEGQQRKQKGLAKIEDKDRHFLILMRKRARQIADMKGRVTTDDLRLHAQLWNIKPKSSHSWGAIFKNSEWLCIGRQASAWKSNNGRHIRIWAQR